MKEEVIVQNPIRTYIYKFYTPNMQVEDGTWKNYWSTVLKSKGVTNLESDIVAKVKALKEGKTLDEVVANIDNDLKPAYKKLIKIGARASWAFKIIEESIRAETENRKPNYIDFPTF